MLIFLYKNIKDGKASLNSLITMIQIIRHHKITESELAKATEVYNQVKENKIDYKTFDEIIRNGLK